MFDPQGRHITYARLSLTEACNFQCSYCRPQVMTESPVPVLRPEQWIPLLEGLSLGGIKALRLTGGEPLLYPYLYELLEGIGEKKLFSDLSMTTNGSLLQNHAAQLKAYGVNRLNISLDAVDELTFQRKVGRQESISTVIDGIEAALSEGFSSIKINTVLQERMAEQDLKQMIELGKTWQVIWRFIEYMPFQGAMTGVPNFASWKEQIERVMEAPLTLVREHLGYGPAQYYEFPWGQRIGFIFPMSNIYCSSCNRIRFTADGQLRLCLLRDEQVNVMEWVQNGLRGRELVEAMTGALQGRHGSHEGSTLNQIERPMWRIGG